MGKIKKITKLIAVIGIAAAISSPVNANAAELTDDAALAQALLLKQAQELQAANYACLLQQAQAIEAANQAYLLQAQAIEAAKQALLLKQQQAFADQYAKALLVYQQAQINQQNALQQSYMLNSVQTMQRAQYQNMVNTNPNLDYKEHLKDEFNKYQQYGISAFNGYEGLK